MSYGYQQHLLAGIPVQTEAGDNSKAENPAEDSSTATAAGKIWWLFQTSSQAPSVSIKVQKAPHYSLIPVRILV